jgi:hypothetical protein
MITSKILWDYICQSNHESISVKLLPVVKNDEDVMIAD